MRQLTIGYRIDVTVMDSESETRVVQRSVKRPWWQRPWIWLGIWSLLVPLVVILAFVRSNQSTIVVYNDTGLPLSALMIRACGQEFRLPRLASDNSFRVKLASEGGESDVVLSSIGEPIIDWAGGYIEPRGGYRIELRVRADGSVVYSEQMSVWSWRY